MQFLWMMLLKLKFRIILQYGLASSSPVLFSSVSLFLSEGFLSFKLAITIDFDSFLHPTFARGIGWIWLVKWVTCWPLRGFKTSQAASKLHQAVSTQYYYEYKWMCISTVCKLQWDHMLTWPQLQCKAVPTPRGTKLDVKKLWLDDVNILNIKSKRSYAIRFFWH